MEIWENECVLLASTCGSVYTRQLLILFQQVVVCFLAVVASCILIDATLGIDYYDNKDDYYKD